MCISTNNNPVERDKDEEELCQSHTPTERTGEGDTVPVNPIDYASLDDDGGGVGGVMMMMVILKVVLFNKPFSVELIKHFALSSSI